MPGPSAAQPTPEPTPPTTPGSADPSPICGLRDDPAHDPATVNMVRQAEAISGNLILGGNHAEPVVTTDDLLARLTADLDTAQHHAHLLYYICRDDRIGQGMAAALIRAAGRGVACRLLLDAAGSRRFLKSPTCRALRDAGVEVHEALPVSLWRKQMARMDLRNHRKIAVIDGRIAYTGSHNMVEPSYGHARAGKWVDLSGRFTGPVVAQVQAVFADDWAFETGQVLDDETFFPVLEPTGDAAGHVIPTGPAAVGETFRRVVVAALHSARHRIILTTPYLVPDEPTMLALAMAVARGVEVTVIVPRRSDQIFVGAAARSYFEPLLEAGVQIHRYTAGLLHAKTITVDDAFALMGSANLDIRSFHLNFELSNLFYGPHITRQMRFAQQSYLADAEELTLDHWSQRPAWKQFLDRAAALLSPVL